MLRLALVITTVLLSYLFIFNPNVVAASIKLPQTGQTSCWDASGNLLASCTGTGQDGDTKSGVSWPVSRYNDNGNGTVTDNLTTLMWSKDANPGVATKTWQNALDYVNTINVSGYMGYGDWRLPNRNELDSLLTPLANYPLISYGHPFTNVQSNYYWSSTSNLSTAYTINTVTGMNLSRTKTNGAYVWLVRGGSWSSSFQYYTIPKTGQNTCFDQSGATITCTLTRQDGELQKGYSLPIPRFTDNGDGTATDNLTDLKWAINANTPGPSICVNAVAKTWQEALDFIKCLNTESYLGYTDWRLPNRTELPSLADRSQNSSIFIDGHPFININFANRYWTSTTAGTNPTYAFAAYMTDAGVSATLKTTPGNVWPVREGQNIVLETLTVTKNGTSTGSVSSSPAGILCGATCTASFASVTSVTLIAVPDAGAVFSGWTGCDSTNSDQCTVTMNAAKSVTATFNQLFYNLDISKVGSGIGTVVTNSGAIIWSGKFGSASYPNGSSVILTATPATDSTFVSWAGCDSISDNQCTVSINSSKYVTAEFTLASSTWFLPQTGQTTCYGNDGVVLSSCVATGQDGELRTGMVWPNPRFTDNSIVTPTDLTISDNLTGLEWPKNGNIMATRDPSFDADGVSQDGQVTWQHALDYVKKLNTEMYLGHNDWRLPNRNELESLVNKHQLSQAEWLNAQGFDNFQNSTYWSSSTYVSYPSSAWVVLMDNGNVDYGIKNDVQYYASHVLPVRSGQTGVVNLPKTGQKVCYDNTGAIRGCSGSGEDGEMQIGIAWPTSRFTDNSIVSPADLTVSDNLTGLVWVKNGNLAAGSMTWQSALDFVATLNSSNYLGQNDWRLPSRNEMESIINIEYADSASWLLEQGFVNIAGWYVTSTTFSRSPSSVWYVNSSMGYTIAAPKAGNFYVWPVRGGQSIPPVNGVCGSSNGATFTAVPTSNLCSTGTPSSTTGTGPWNWSCAGTNGGSTASCMAALGYNLSISVWLETGSGGTVTSSSNTAAGIPADIICTSGTCNAVYPSGSEVSVVATPNSISQLSGMYNLTTPISSPYNFTMNGLAGPFNISFSKASFAKNATTGISYSTLTQAIVAALANAEILLLDTQHDGEVTLDKNLKLVGGWNTTYSVKSGMHSVLKGNVTVTGGNSTAETLLVLGTLIIQGGSLIANDMMIQFQ